jgi:hypothetical protein
LGLESGRLGCGSEARGGHPAAPAQQGGAAAMGAGAARLLPRAPTGCVTGKRDREKGIRMVADGWGPLGGDQKER